MKKSELRQLIREEISSSLSSDTDTFTKYFKINIGLVKEIHKIISDELRNNDSSFEEEFPRPTDLYFTLTDKLTKDVKSF